MKHNQIYESIIRDIQRISEENKTLENKYVQIEKSLNDKTIETSKLEEDIVIEETEKNADSMKQALKSREVDGIAAMAHKLLPLFTLIGASDILPLLSWLETKRGECFSEEISSKTEVVLQQIQIILEEAKRYSKIE